MGKMCGKRWLSFMLAACLLLAALAGCGNREKEKVTVAFWSDQLTERYGPYLQESFPEVDFEFYVATNSTDFYRFKEENGSLPDILTVRRFSLSDVEGWRDSLMDLSGTEIAASIHQSYLRSYTYSDGTVNWLPTCAEVDSIVINRPLLEKHGLSVPENYEEFVAVCRALEKKGVRPFLSNYSADFTCMELLQGLSASRLTSQEGREWRQLYESGQTSRLSEEVWLPVFQRMEEFLDYTGAVPSDVELEHQQVLEAFRNGEAAMIRGTGNEEAIRDSQAGDVLLMPYFGDTQEDNWYLTYPAFQVAASARAEESPERRALILEILETMLNGEGQKHIAGGHNMIPYSKSVELPLSEGLSHLQPYADKNRLYIRLASSDMFSISQQVVQGMIKGDYPDAQSAFDAFNQAMSAPKEEEPPAARIETAYPYAFNPQGGSPAASALFNSLREILGADLLIGQASNVAGDIAAGGYTLEELGYLTMGESSLGIFSCRLTGEQLYRYVEYLLTTPGKRGSVCNDSTLYVSSGFEMEVKREGKGYALQKLTIQGRELEGHYDEGQAFDKGRLYELFLVGDENEMQREALAAAGVEEYLQVETTFKLAIAGFLAEGRQLCAPTDYITLE